jgi:hypothetical protein
MDAKGTSARKTLKPIRSMENAKLSSKKTSGSAKWKNSERRRKKKELKIEPNKKKSD